MCGEICEKTGEPYYIEAHRHKAYRWVYDCGGHMGAVIYVTVGNVSRLMGMDAAKDVDYTTVNPDKSENTDTTDTTEG